ncbi:hypothetical protein HDU97_003742 [Phlyctochytrium planicorne]|nr:hypothetical protein HDU97_003742 [Phlyctochytrium planicorne]
MEIVCTFPMPTSIDVPNGARREILVEFLLASAVVMEYAVFAGNENDFDEVDWLASISQLEDETDLGFVDVNDDGDAAIGDVGANDDDAAGGDLKRIMAHDAESDDAPTIPADFDLDLIDDDDLDDAVADDALD